MLYRASVKFWAPVREEQVKVTPRRARPQKTGVDEDQRERKIFGIVNK